MNVDDAIAAIQQAVRLVAPDALHAAGVAEGIRVLAPGKKFSSHAELVEVYPDGAAFAAAVARGDIGAVAGAMHALAALDADAVLAPALALARGGKGEPRRAAAFALAHSRSDDALAILLDALEPGGKVPRGALDRSRHPDATARVRAALAASGQTVFAVRRRPTFAEWLALPGDERRAYLDATPGGAPSPELQRASTAIAVLGARKDVDSVELIVRMFEAHPDDRIRLACAHALAALDDPRAHGALDARLADPDEVIATIAVRAALRRDLATAWDRFAPHVGVATRADEAIVASLLYVIHGGMTPRKVAPAEDPLVVEPRFIDLAARLRRHPAVGPSARMMLEVVPIELARAAIARHPATPPAIGPVAIPARRDFLARYHAGEYAVWRELVALAPAIAAHPDLGAEAAAVAAALMQRVRANTDAVRTTLLAAGVTLADERAPATDAELARLVAMVGPLPVALDALFRTVGSINLLPGGDDRYDYGEVGLEADGISLLGLDPLALSGVGDDIDWQLDQYQERVSESDREIVGPLALDLAADFLHKQDVSGGGPYAIELPPSADGGAVDPPIEAERHGVRLVEYLRLCFRWGGFPGLDVIELPQSKVDLNLRIPFRAVKGPWRPAGERLLAQLRRGVESF